jgi:hypothetical protein
MKTNESAQYQRPPETVLSLLHTPPIPSVSISPNRQFLLMADRLNYPPVSELAIPVLKLAGLRINPANRGPWQQPRITGLRLLAIPDGPESSIELPPGVRIGLIGWSPDSRYYALTIVRLELIELWIVDTHDASARRLGNNIQLNMTYGVPAQWTSDSLALLVQLPAFQEHQKPIARSRLPVRLQKKRLENQDLCGHGRICSGPLLTKPFLNSTVRHNWH